MPWGNGRSLEARLEKSFGLQHVLLAPRAALGLMATLQAWREGGANGNVALSAAVCHDVVAAVLGAGCTPVFVDIDPRDGTVSAAEWQKARAAGASAALVVHLYGNPSDMRSPRLAFAASGSNPAGLIIEDCAQALGSRGPDVMVGCGGNADVVLLSFGATKQIDVGGAALLFRDGELASAAQAALAAVATTSKDDLETGRASFRARFEQARGELRANGDNAAHAFSRVLDGYSPLLQVPFPVGCAEKICAALDSYPADCSLRIEKMSLWRNALASSRLIPVGMGAGTVPWRYTCRLEGIDWIRQHALGERMRAGSVNVSHWYLPAHWLCGMPAGTLPGVEKLAREVFQFWVDAPTNEATIHSAAQHVLQVLDATL